MVYQRFATFRTVRTWSETRLSHNLCTYCKLCIEVQGSQFVWQERMIRDTELPRMNTRRAGEGEEGRDSPRASAVNNKANRTARGRGSIGSKAGHMHRLRRATSRVKASRSPPPPRTITAVTHTRDVPSEMRAHATRVHHVAHAPGPSLPLSQPFTRQIDSHARGTHFHTTSSLIVFDCKTWLTDGAYGIPSDASPITKIVAHAW